MFNPSNSATLTSEKPLNLFDVLDAVTSLPVTHKPIDFWVYLVLVALVACFLCTFGAVGFNNGKNIKLKSMIMMISFLFEILVFVPNLSRAQNTQMMEYSNETFELAVKTLNSSEEEKQAVKEILEKVQARGPLWERFFYPDHYDALLLRLYAHAVKNKFAWEDVKH